MADERRYDDAIALHGEVGGEIVWARGDSPIGTGRRAWAAHDSLADWHVVLQDDAIACGDFHERLHDVLRAASGAGPVSLYLGTGRPRQSATRDAIRAAQPGDAFIEMPWLCWGVGIALPVAHIAAMLIESEHSSMPYDFRISQVYEARRVPTQYAWPSLVDHRDDDSLVHRAVDASRRAYWFAGHAPTTVATVQP